jgi:hypothetical protein
MGRCSSRTLLVALGLSAAAAFALWLDIADPGPRRAIITVCLLVAAATVFQVWHTARVRENAAEGARMREQHAKERYRDLKAADSDHN